MFSQSFNGFPFITNYWYRKCSMLWKYFLHVEGNGGNNNHLHQSHHLENNDDKNDNETAWGWLVATIMLLVPAMVWDLAFYLSLLFYCFLGPDNYGHIYFAALYFCVDEMFENTLNSPKPQLNIATWSQPTTFTCITATEMDRQTDGQTNRYSTSTI